MKTLKISIICLTVLFLNDMVSAQCAEIYFYRTNGFQSKKPVMLYQNGEQLATVNPGERYKANVCTNDKYQFVVRTSEGDLVPGKVDLNLETGKQYYLKIACAVGVELASIKPQEVSKGNKEVNNGSKFIGAIKPLSVKEKGSISSNVTTSTNSSSENKVFQKSQVVDNFKFDVVNITKAGELLTIDYKITNLSADDRRLETCPNMIYFYDDLGNLLFPKKVVIANSSVDFRNAHRAAKVWDKYVCYDGPSHAIMPAGIPLKAQIVVGGINKRATKFVRGNVQFKTEVPFELTYNNLEFPELIDASNPNKRNFGPQSIELMEAIKDSTFTFIHFRHYNNDPELYDLKIKGGSVYDDLGNQHEPNALSFGSKHKKVRAVKYRSWDTQINSGSTLDFYVFFDGIPASASQIRRVSLTFEGFSLSWENQVIVGGGAAIIAVNQPGPNYIEYEDFETKVRNKESVLGSKVILDNIYFSTGSDVILERSHSQLNKLGQLMGLYGNLKVEVSGHTDSVGDDISNMVLSQKRADAIKYYLIGKSINPSRVISTGKGENEPIANNATDLGKKENRRVELKVIE